MQGIQPQNQNLFDTLMKRISYAKTSLMPQQALYEAYGQIKMAFELKAITNDEFFKLNTECVRDGINNPKYFNK